MIKQINLLENSLNLQLFERTHRGLTSWEWKQIKRRDVEKMLQEKLRYDVKLAYVK